METEPQYSITVEEYIASKGAILRLTQNSPPLAVLIKFNDGEQVVSLSECRLSAEQFQAALAGLIELGNLNLKWSAE